MLKSFFAIVFILLFSSLSFSQIVQDYGFKIGYVNSSQNNTNKDIDGITARKSGYSVSAFVDLFDLNGFSISPEIKYIQKGVGYEFIITGPEGPEPLGKKTEYIYHNYLSIPLSLLYKVQFGFGAPFIKIAPRYDILLSSSDDFNTLSSNYDDYKNVFGGTFSIGLIPKLKIAINPFIEISYHMDFSNTYTGVNNKIKNNALEVCIGLLL
jgi:hypothetical protein